MKVAEEDASIDSKRTIELTPDEVQRVLHRFQQICNHMQLELQTQVPGYRMHINFDKLEAQIHDVVNNPDAFVGNNHHLFRDEVRQQPLFHRSVKPATVTTTNTTRDAPATASAGGCGSHAEGPKLGQGEPASTSTTTEPSFPASAEEIAREIEWVENALRERIEVLNALRNKPVPW